MLLIYEIIFNDFALFYSLLKLSFQKTSTEKKLQKHKLATCNNSLMLIIQSIKVILLHR